MTVRLANAACVVWLGCVAGAAAHGQGAVRGEALLPDAPGSQAGAQTIGPGSIRGSVLDINGGLVPGATVTLMEEGRPEERVTHSDAEGRFAFGELPAGRYKVTIASPGLQTFLSNEILLKAAERYELPRVDLGIAATSSEVQVTVTMHELAEEQVKAEEKQRVAGVIPNFYSSYIWNAPPLSSGQKMELVGRSIFDPVDFLGVGVAAGIQQAHNTYPGYGQGAEGYAKRYGASFANRAIGRGLGSGLLPVIFRQDPRYFYRGTGSVRTRVLYALSRTVICRSDKGREMPNYSEVLGAFAAGGLANLYHTGNDRGARLTVDNALLNIAGNAGANLVREFVLRRLTPKVPEYAKGKPEGEAGR